MISAQDTMMADPNLIPPIAAGTYRGGGGQGFHPLWPGEGAAWHVGSAYTPAPNASFSVYSARHGLHYIVDEDAVGRVGVHRHRAGGWETLASVETGGSAPCHVALNHAETLLAVANYMSGSVSLIRLDPRSGLPVGAAQTNANDGSGPNAERQEGPHAHWVGFSPDGRWLYQTDLGTDEVLAFTIDAAGRLEPPFVAYAAPPGSGPRHLVLHPHLAKRVYLVSEMASTLTMLDRADDGTFTNPVIRSTLPEGWRGHSIVAHVAINAARNRLYVSNRGHDSIAVFALDADGVPTLLEHVGTGGEYPRFFLLLEDRRVIVVAHEKSQTVTTLAIDADGRLSATGVDLAIPGVAYVLEVAPKGG
jgi:6-phosphogluconolactonase